MKVELINNPDLFRLAEILTKLRYKTKHWEQHYGADARNQKKFWEKKADEWIDKHIKKNE